MRDISIAPVAMNDQEEILTMMDNEDGVQRVRLRRKEIKKKWNTRLEMIFTNTNIYLNSKCLTVNSSML